MKKQSTLRALPLNLLATVTGGGLFAMGMNGLPTAQIGHGPLGISLNGKITGIPGAR